MKQLDLIRDVLDKQVVDADETKMGRVDGVVLQLRDGEPPRVQALEMGFVTLALRVGRRTERAVEALRRRFSVRRTARYRVPWEKVIDVNVDHVQVDVDDEQTPAFDWERWLRFHIVRKVPGEKE
jgi:sporulation protein YlmC with PRC-barrel domain